MARVSAATRDVLSAVSRLPLHAVVELRSPDGREVFLLGETHVKTRRAAGICRQAVQDFSLRGVERLQRDQVFAGRLLGALLGTTRGALQLFSGGRLAGSTIEVALDLPEGNTVELERSGRVPFGLHAGAAYLAVYMGLVLPALLLLPWWGTIASLRPLRVTVKLLGLHLYALPIAYVFRERPWASAIQPLLAILTVRDALLADGIRRMVATHPAQPALVIVGRAHVRGLVARLLEHGFRRADPGVQGSSASKRGSGHRSRAAS
ncbi:MAG: hypothetical protein EHM78_24215 [Myxococcaceae bacterium]|nr:MAG: hypothetical protein EHM78_24215 [Myxococcaceae bacterium]